MVNLGMHNSLNVGIQFKLMEYIIDFTSLVVEQTDKSEKGPQQLDWSHPGHPYIRGEQKDLVQ